MTVCTAVAVLLAPPAEPMLRPPEEGVRLRTRLIVIGVRFHDSDRLGGTAITDVDAAGEDPQWPGHELRDLGIPAMAEGAAHRSSQHIHTFHSNLRVGRSARERTTMHAMAMGKRTRDRQPAMWVPTTELPTSASHPFYARLNQLLRDRG